ncbi:MAG: alkaline phosphatase family protein [Alistipes sp.]|nr:alkaline phosphatase family protein [Alistipes sp.]MBQ5618303.1 alkaline phosphatase family protein [Alistipes sp.]MBQ5923329.1 alkaline phosphatase family protein [Alistipes sp.]
MRFTRYIVVIAVFILSAASMAMAQTEPRLVVNIVISSMGANDLDRYADNFSSAGLRRIINGGQRFTNASYDYMQTTTPVSLATLSTGATPSIHGVVADRWFDYVGNKEVSLIEDRKEQSVNYSGGSGSYSPRNLVAQTLSDALAQQHPDSHIATIAVEPLSAIVMAGRSGEVYWMETLQSSWTTSSYYSKELPKWIADYNYQDQNEEYAIKRWTSLLPYDNYHNSQVSVVEGLQSKTNKRIIHVQETPLAKGTMDDIYYQMCYTPAGNSAMLAFAREVVVHNKMGGDAVPDMLNIVLDTPRLISNRFGPESVEYEDMLYRLDRDLESFLSFLATQVAAPEQLLIVLTSDHGTSPSYNATEDVRERFNVRQAEVITNAFIGSLYGNGDWILGCIDRAIYLNHNLIMDKGLSLEQIQNDVATFVMQLRGVSQAVTAESMRGSYFGSGYGRKIQNGFYPRRSGDVVLNLMPEWIEEREQTRSMSGSMYRYDTQVPLIIYGAGCKAQLRNDKIDMTSLAATQAEILGIMAPSAAEGEEITIIYE